MPTGTSRIVCLSALFAAALPLAADTYPRQPGIDAIHYSFRLELTDSSDEIKGETTIDLRFVQSGVMEFALDLTSVSGGKGMTVTEIASAGTPLKFVHQSDRLRIQLPSAPAEGERHQYTIQYHGVPLTGLRIGKNKYGDRTFFSENWPDKARQWLPMIDHPYDKATSEFVVTAPVRYQVVANGLLQEEQDLGDGRRLTHWKQSIPISSWLNAVGVAEFASRHTGSAHGVPLETWVFHQDREAGITIFDRAARQAIEFYSDRIGPFPYEKLGNVEAAGLTGGTEHASAIFYGEKAVNGKTADGLVAHEIAHQWFGDAVTEKDWDDVWLSEGFATYCTLLFTEHYQGRDAFLAGVKKSRESIWALEKKLPDAPVIHNNLADMKKVLNRLIYEKGGWTLHMLRGMLGDDRFWAGLRDYYAQYRDKNVTTDDFRRVMEEHSGLQLSWFFDQWLHRAGSPVVQGSWRYNAAAKRVEIELAQTQAGEPYRLPVQFGLLMEGGAPMHIEKTELSQSRQTFQIAADKEPVSVVLDPNTWLLMDARFEKR